jgi:hypothetical protein
MHLLIHLFILNKFWTGRIKTKEARGYSTKIPRLRAQTSGLWVVFLKRGGLLCKNGRAKGYGEFCSARSITDGGD